MKLSAKNVLKKIFGSSASVKTADPVPQVPISQQLSKQELDKQLRANPWFLEPYGNGPANEYGPG